MYWIHMDTYLHRYVLLGMRLALPSGGTHLCLLLSCYELHLALPTVIEKKNRNRPIPGASVLVLTPKHIEMPDN
jgi:hypothetical protein